MAKRVDYEERFYIALKRITAYMAPERLRRQAEKQYGLGYEETLEMAYENVIGEAQSALRGYRKPRVKPEPSTLKRAQKASPSRPQETPQ